jgi:hypothetical protein
MEKTALNQAIELIQHYRACQEPTAFAEYHAASVALHHLQLLLPTEQHQIEAAFAAGHIDGMTDPENLSCYQPSDYFTTKYQ